MPGKRGLPEAGRNSLGERLNRKATKAQRRPTRILAHGTRRTHGKGFLNSVSSVCSAGNFSDGGYV